jgi:hypothetical protein
MPQHPQGWQRRLQREQDLRGVVRTAVVDEDHFVGNVREGCIDLPRERLDVLGLVAHRNDDGKV